MGNFRPLPTKCGEAFLKYNGFKYSGRTKGSHDQWTKKGYRTIPVWGDEKQIPAMHLKTGRLDAHLMIYIPGLKK